MPPLILAPSILSADFGKLNQEIAAVESFCDLIHVDVMDGHFVPNLSLGVPVVESIRSGKPLDVHLMIENPEKYLEVFAKAVEKAVGLELKQKSYLVVHQETAQYLEAAIDAIHNLGMLAGVALNPGTSIMHLDPVLGKIDMVLCMTVWPGFGGQAFIPEVLEKVRELRSRAPNLNIQVDGGINATTAKSAHEAGANVLVAGSYVFGAEDRKAALASLRA